MKRVLVLTKYSQLGASSRMRTIQYIDYLKSQGFSIEVSSLYDDEYLKNLYSVGKRTGVVRCYLNRLKVLLQARQFDMLWVEKELFPYSPAVFERLLKLLSIPYVVDYDDAIFANYQYSRHRLVRLFLKNKIATVMRLSTHVVAGNKYLAEYAEASGAKRVTIVPAVIDAEKYQVSKKDSEKQLTIGWIGSPTTQIYLANIAKPIETVCKQFNAKLAVMGASHSIKDAFKSVELEIYPWSEDEEVAFVQSLDVGVMPLVDGPWEKGKCGFKLIQYMGCAVPVMASPVGVNENIVLENNCGLLARSEQEWLDGMTSLLQSESLRQQYGQAGRVAVDNCFSAQVQQKVLGHIWQETCDSQER
ncbi:glycosyltransferase family 4 protein [Agarivorans sp. 1_MG-2023]|uniref:glycosyltransferase family 4 protein n=1 Tax=Agarivorans sp. 1_MG-2023 TaxID=3062634 RepID=UPI0026E169AF|nr:glycosyltransferase family 4 protein [Agarivorans sp. 1_MG-2023]MDO6764818.1 glycosyltransferase family 4 protein [Agarivorans sp. 1_MG-2023]